MLTWSEIETSAIAFQKTWKNTSGDERQDGQTFEKDFMNIFGVNFRDGFREYQLILKDGSIGYIDYLLPGKILIEMKSKGKSLSKAYTQAMDYVHSLKPEEIPEIVMVSDFDKIEVYNLKKDIKYKTFKVSQLKNHIRIFGLLAGYNEKFEDVNEIELNIEASYKMSKLHNQLKEYGYDKEYLEIFLVRLLFCLFADDTSIFEKDSFKEYIENSNEDGSDLSMRIMLLFNILDTPSEKRMKNIPIELNRFRYINGNLFSKQLPPAMFDKKMRSILLECCNFDWSKISPTIFGAMFQGIMDQKGRRETGAHYTSEENILKVIKPLFLDELYIEFERAKSTKKELEDFHNKIANLKFLDPACGSGNFLILTYQKLRELEFEILKYLNNTSQLSLFDIYSKVHINQFYGIEYEPFATEIAKISMLLMKHLMDRQISNYFGQNIIDFPIKENANISNANALELEWENVDYIMGNPPFIGAMLQSKNQKEDVKRLMGHIKGYGELDYVTCWFYKASLKIKENPNLKVAFVSTNSICQGQHVIIFWKELMENLKITIDFAYQNFIWSNDAKSNAKVYCVIVGFSINNNKSKKLFVSDGNTIETKNINPYLNEGENIFIDICKKPIGFKSEIKFGSMPRDGGFLILTDEEKEEFEKIYPISKDWIKKYIGAKEFIDRTYRYVLWLKDINISEIRKCPKILDRIQKVREFRLNSKAQATKKFASTPSLFCQIAQPEKGHYIAIPRVSSEKREYIPIGFLNSQIICSDSMFLLPDASLIDFAILTSNVHMAWMRTFAGRLESRYRYSKDIVYNTFPVHNFDEKTKEKLEKTAQNILDIREKYYNNSYADLYDSLFMPNDLKKAHRENDRAVWEAYGKAWQFCNEDDCISYLMRLYKELSK